MHLLQLPAEEKLQIIGELWDSIDAKEPALNREQIEEIERREQLYSKNPGSAIPWEQVKDSILRPDGSSRSRPS